MATSELQRVTLSLCRGQRIAWSFTLKDATGAVRSDLDGKTAVFTARSTAYASDPPALQVTSGTITAGVATVTLSRTNTLTLAAGDYVWMLFCAASGVDEPLNAPTSPLVVYNSIYDAPA